MIEAGINEGDTVIVKKTNTADDGKIVVALTDDHEAMLKRIRRKGKTVGLESANRNYETKIWGTERVKDKGMPGLRGGGFGDLYLQIKVEIPVNLNKEQKILLEKFKELEDSKNNPENESFFKKEKIFGII